MLSFAVALKELYSVGTEGGLTCELLHKPQHSWNGERWPDCYFQCFGKVGELVCLFI